MLFKVEPKPVRIVVEYDGQSEDMYVVGQDFNEVLGKIEAAFGGTSEEAPKPEKKVKPRRKRRTKAEIAAATVEPAESEAEEDEAAWPA